MWDTETGEPLCEMKDHAEQVKSVAPCPTVNTLHLGGVMRYGSGQRTVLWSTRLGPRPIITLTCMTLPPCMMAAE